jgi:hypothetical protein
MFFAERLSAAFAASALVRIFSAKISGEWNPVLAGVLSHPERFAVCCVFLSFSAKMSAFGQHRREIRHLISLSVSKRAAGSPVQSEN